MKKIITLIIVLMLMTVFTACNTSALSETYNEQTVIGKAKEIVEYISEKDFDSASNQVRDDLKEQLSADFLENALDSIITDAGKFNDYQSVITLSQKSDYSDEALAVTMVVCTYENKTYTYTISMDKNYDIVGIYIK